MKCIASWAPATPRESALSRVLECTDCHAPFSLCAHIYYNIHVIMDDFPLLIFCFLPSGMYYILRLEILHVYIHVHIYYVFMNQGFIQL